MTNTNACNTSAIADLMLVARGHGFTLINPDAAGWIGGRRLNIRFERINAPSVEVTVTAARDRIMKRHPAFLKITARGTSFAARDLWSMNRYAEIIGQLKDLYADLDKFDFCSLPDISE